MNRAKLILMYGWLTIAIFGSIIATVSLKAALIIAVFSISCGTLVVAIGAKRKETTAGIERLIALSKLVEKGLNYRPVRAITHLIFIPLVFLQKLGYCIFNKRYQYRFSDMMLRPFDEVTEEYYAAVIIFPYAVMFTLGLVLLLVSRNG